MKSIIISLALLLSLPAMARDNRTGAIDTLDHKIKEIHFRDRQEKAQVKKTEVLSDPIHRAIYQRSQNPRFRGHWSGFNLGFADFGDYEIIPGGSPFMDLQRKNSFVMQFNMFQYSMRLSKLNNFGLVTGLGLEYQRLRFQHKNSIQRGENGIIHSLEMERVKKSSLKNLYLTVPLICEYQFPAKQHRRAYVGAGIMGGLRLHTKTKVVYKNEDGESRRFKKAGNYSMNPVKADVIVRVGYDKIALWGSYTLNRMMKSGKAPDLHAYVIGCGINF